MAPLGISQQALFDYRAKHDDLTSAGFLALFTAK